MQGEDAREFLVRAQQLLDEGQFEKAMEWIDKGYQASPGDPKISQLFEQLYLAHGIRLARRGRDLRRDALQRENRWRSSAPDPPEVKRAFQEALDGFDRVLTVNPDNVKALVMKGATLYRMDRKGRRAEVLAFYEKALQVHPESEELRYASAMVNRRCNHCGDSGYCPSCHGRGQVSALVFRSTCPTCRGSGVCTRCAIL